ncbi:efflux RND transporter periplasmic adaptor subunit [Flavihumibacter sp. RY-1]|uniref:Efflux RND transporter periplasmic adaptor subunit n=1 Tax=Flavihumibacter fluminis TaxID=2909236 RepID=A0ABS9BHZ8_9BACT|nr:efflux RND transporter periplasmic adaptor subunit [Flavihumibacter fluminis]MCF1715333.1 efflux RND transporter periplasmic adaptor subunit [Flavihumibacter fluminis]
MLLLAACSSDEHQQAVEKKPAPIAVELSSPVVSGTGNIVASGKVEAIQTAYISTRLMGVITSLPVKLGDRVQKGQVLAVISSDDLKAKRAQTDAMISEAEANLENAARDLERFTVLHQKQSASAKELENITLQYNAARARAEAARQMKNEVTALMGYATLKAPFSGIVTQKNAEAGSMASPGMPLLAIEQGSAMQIVAAIPESEIKRVEKGATARIEIKSSDKIFSGKISEINPSSQFTGGQYLVKISIPEGEQKGVYSGMYVNVNIPLKTSDAGKTGAILVPKSSLVERDQLYGIYTISNNSTALLRQVRLGKTVGDQVEIISGLGSEETFILKADGKLYNGAPVKKQ